MRAPLYRLAGVLSALLSLVPAGADARIDPPFSADERVVFAKRSGAEGIVVSDFTLESGIARLRVAGKRANVAIAMKAEVRDGALRSGYRLRIHGGRAHLERVRRGKGRALVPSRGFRRAKSMELVLAIYGDLLVARVFDATSGRQLVTLSARDRTPGAGVVAVIAGKKRRGTVTWVRFSARRACRAIPRRTAKAPPLFVTGTRTELAGFDVLERLPRKRAVVRLSLPELERLHCGGARPERASIDVPFKYRDADYRKRRSDRSPRMDDDGAPRLDLSVKNPHMARAILELYHQRHPARTRLEQLVGPSHRKRRITALVVGNHVHSERSVPSFLVIGAHHGNEPMSVDFVLDAARRLLEVDDERSRRWLEEFEIWFVPVANPDGSYAFLERSIRMGRKNGREQDGHDGMTSGDGVDLNRNYPFRWGALGEKGSKRRKSSPWYRGPEAGSEPETRAIMALADREHFAGLLTYHGGTVALLAPYTIDGVENPTANEAWLVAEHLIANLPEHPQGKRFRVRDKLYSVDGTDQDWHRFQHGTVALLVEGARRTPRSAARRRELHAAVLPLFERLLDRFLSGAVSGIVVDARGHPVRAQVDIAQVATAMGERWTTRCPDGRFDRFLPGPGPIEVVVRVNDQVVATRKLDVGAEHRTIRIQLEKPMPSIRCPTPVNP